jgi:hypothetical protein
MAGHVAKLKENHNTDGIFVGNYHTKYPLRSPKRRWQIAIKTDIQKVCFGGVECQFNWGRGL